MDNFFVPVQNTKPYFKAAFEGFAGTGKTRTSAEVAIGIHHRIKSQKPVIMFDTEKASKFMKEIFDKEGIELLVRESRSLADLSEAMKRCREGASDILIIDSITHIYQAFLEDYMARKNRTRMEFQDWGVVKPMWNRMFVQPFVKDPYHIIFTGRAGFEYDNEMNQETGKRELIKTGVKMKVEGETAYEPDLLVLMEMEKEMHGDELKRVYRTAFIVKDRSDKIDGKKFENPSYKDFAPAIEAILKDPSSVETAPEKSVEYDFRSEEERFEFRKERERWYEEIEALLQRVFPGATGKDRASKLEVLHVVFGTSSDTAIKDLHPDRLKKGYSETLETLLGMDFVHWAEKDGKRVLRIGAKPAPEIPVATEGGEKAETPATGNSAALKPESAAPSKSKKGGKAPATA